MYCKNCGNDSMIYMGIVDDAGDDGDSVADEWECPKCGYIAEGRIMRIYNALFAEQDPKNDSDDDS